MTLRDCSVRVAQPKRRLGVRHLQAGVMALSCLVAYALRANLSVAVVAMVDDDQTNNNTRSEERIGPGGAMVFDWDEPVRGAILSAFFWGYMLSQVPAGVLSQRLGGSRLLAGALLSTSLITLALPLCAQLGGWRAVFANRALQGLTQAPVFPSIFTLLGVWMPPRERDVITTVILACQMLGPMFASPLSGFMAALWGWPSIFYAFGALGVLSAVAVWALGADRPSLHQRISPEELAYIESSLSSEEPLQTSLRTPWRAVLTSPPVWVVWSSTSVQDMAFFTFITIIPTYLNGVLKFSLEENGMLSSLPYLVGFLVSLLASVASSCIRNRELLSITNSRKFFNGIASVGISMCVVLTAYVSSRAASVTLICLSMGFMCVSFVGTQANCLDLAPLHAGPIYSVGNVIGAVLGVLGPQLVGFVVTDVSDVGQWQTVFWGTAFVLMATFVLYTWLGSGEVQPWNDPHWSIRKRNQVLEEEFGADINIKGKLEASILFNYDKPNSQTTKKV